MKRNTYMHESVNNKPVGVAVQFAEEVLGYQWLEDCGGTSHWRDKHGKCKTFLPHFIFELRTDQLRALIRHERTRKKK